MFCCDYELVSWWRQLSEGHTEKGTIVQSVQRNHRCVSLFTMSLFPPISTSIRRITDIIGPDVTSASIDIKWLWPNLCTTVRFPAWVLFITYQNWSTLISHKGNDKWKIARIWNINSHYWYGHDIYLATWE